MLVLLSPRDFVLLAKSLAMTAGTVLQLDPDLNLVELIQPRIKRLMMQRFSVRNIFKSMGISAWHVLNILKNAPGQLRNAIRHSRAVDEVTQKYGEASIVWFRQVIARRTSCS